MAATTGLYTRMGFALTGIEDSTKLTIRIVFRQRGNWQVCETLIPQANIVAITSTGGRHPSRRVLG